MIQTGTERMTPAIRECIRKCYTMEDPRYFEFFFRYLYRPEWFFVDNEKNTAAALVCRIPHDVMFNGRILRMSMLCYACTSPEYRNQGRIRRVIETALDACSHTELITLVPGEYSEAYRPFGFEPIYYRTEYTITRENARRMSNIGCAYEPNPLDMLKVYSAFIRRFNGFYARDLEYFVNLKREIGARGGKIVAYYNEKDQIQGYATVLIGPKDATIEECVYLDSMTLNKLVNAALQERAVVHLRVSDAENLSRLFAESQKRSFPSVLARLNDAALFSRLFSCEVSDVKSAFAISQQPLYLSEKI